MKSGHPQRRDSWAREKCARQETAANRPASAKWIVDRLRFCQRGLGEAGVHAPGYQRALSRGQNLPAPKKENIRHRSSNSRTAPSDERVSSSSQTSRQSSADADKKPAQLTGNGLALSTRKRELWTPKAARTRALQCLPTGDQACSPPIRQASRAGAFANGSTRVRASTNGLRSDSREELPTLERLCSWLDFPLDWLYRTFKHNHPCSSRSAS